MGLDIPSLDDRTFEELLEDARKRIPVHSEQWTDHNAHDPGITILETLAFVAESELYRLDRVTDDHVETYLSLLGASPEPPQPATAHLRMDPQPAAVGRTVPASTRLAAEDVDGVVRTFETDTPVTLTDATVGAVVSDHARGRTDHTTATRNEGMSFLAFGEEARDGSALYIGFEGDPFVGGLLDLAIDFHESGLPAPASHGDEESTFEPSVAVTWEYCPDYGSWRHDDGWAELRVLRDETRQFYSGGLVRLERPADWNADPAEILDHPRSLRWLRCRIVREGDEAAFHEVPPKLDGVYTNAVTATHRTTRTGEKLSRPDGGDRTTAHPDQTFAFEHAPVLDATISVGGETWEGVDSFDGSGPDDHHYVLDEAAGTISFGDEVRGRIPPPDREVVAEKYVHGGGAGGNVTARADWRFAGEGFADVAIEFRGAGGGRDAETIDGALARFRSERDTPFRAVTTDDYRYVATHTPGLRFGRAAAVVEEADPRVGGAGDCEQHKQVRVVVVPYSPRERPRPSEGFLDAVRRHVERHRLVTDRVTVEPPTYVGVGVRTEVGIAPDYSEAGRIEAIEAALAGFLHPLRGFDGDGWPFGRPVYPSEVYETVDAVEGVDCVFDVSLSSPGERDAGVDGSIDVGQTSLVYSGSHDVAVRGNRDDCGGGP